MQILLVKMADSMFNRSIWEGLSRAWTSLGHRVVEVDAHALKNVEALSDLPEVLFAVHGGTVPTSIIDGYRRRGVTTAVYLLDEPYEVDRSSAWARHYEFVFSVDRQTVPHHAQFSRADHLPLAFDADRFRPDGRAYACEILVLGSPFEHRLQLLAPLRARFGKHITWVGPGWQPFCPSGRHVDQLVTPDICARFYRGASFVINIHRDSFWSHYGETNTSRIAATHLNPRFWESAACGAFQLCSHRADLAEFDGVVESFDTTDQLGHLIEAYWDAPEERRRLEALASQAVRQHTYKERAETILARFAHAQQTSPDIGVLQPVGKENSLGDDK